VPSDQDAFPNTTAEEPPREPAPEDPAGPETVDDPRRTRAAGAGAETASTLPSVPGYEILGELGRGGMGVVYQARQVKADRLVALKMILAGAGADAADLARFRTEARAIARLTHPHIVGVYDVGEWRAGEGQPPLPYFSLEFCAGGSLEKRLRGTPLPAGEAAQVVAVLARAMQAAHDRGVIHRDLKPANVLLTEDGTPKVTDFGLAKRLDDAGQTASGVIMGTPSYMAPEQARGAVKELGPAADVYALGAILYECLTGRPPFRAATLPDTLLQVVSEEPVPPRRLNARVPADLETVCLKCLQKEPARRYASAAALAEDLERFQAGEPIVAKAVGPLERLAKWARRRPAVAGLSAAVLLVTLLGVGLVTWKWLEAVEQARLKELALKDAEESATRERAAHGEAVEALARARTQEGLARAAEEKTRRELRRTSMLLYANQIDGAYRAWRANQIDRIGEMLTDTSPDLHHWEYRYLQKLLEGSLATLRGHTRPVFAVAYSPDGKRLATAGGASLALQDPGDGDVIVWDAASGKQLLSFHGHASRVSAIAFSPDGMRLATASHDRTVKLWEAGTGKELLSLGPHLYGVSSVAFSPDGRLLASTTGEIDAPFKVTFISPKPKQPDPNGWMRSLVKGEAKIWDAVTGKVVHTLAGHTDTVTRAAFSPDGKRLATASWDRTVRLWNVDTGKEERALQGHAGKVTAVAFSADGKLVAGGSGSLSEPGIAAEVKVWDADTGKGLHALRGHTQPVAAVAFSPAAPALLATAGGDPYNPTRPGEIKLWDAVQGKEMLDCKGHRGGVTAVTFSPDGKRLASGSADTLVKLWDPAVGAEMRVVQGPGRDVVRVAFSPDGGLLAGGSEDGTVAVWDRGTMRELAARKGHRRVVSAVAFHPDGRLLTGSLDETVKVWEARTGQELFALEQGNVVYGLAVSSDGKLLAVARGDYTVVIWDLAERRITQTLRHAEKTFQNIVAAVALSPDGTLVASGGMDRTVKVWETATGRLRQTFPHPDIVHGVAFSPDGRTVASACADKTVRLWDPEGKREPVVLRGHLRAVHNMAFSADGARLLSSAADDTVRVWDPATGVCILTLARSGHWVCNAAFSPDGRFLAHGVGNAVWVRDAGPPAGAGKP
jgi:WD40 repeat protein